MDGRQNLKEIIGIGQRINNIRNERMKIFSQIIDQIKCDVTDSNGNHCPEDVAYRVKTNRGEAYLCEGCFKNVKNGAYKNIEIENILNKLD